ncbi:hypothetical protein V6N13_114134 [Hibiscus sabdariffa]|uniref:Uncharacterized protein n=1 Tax=Hibiscus sabdariffa TaxID=183260 RepID=A0ABR2U0W0_9ROSI
MSGRSFSTPREVAIRIIVLSVRVVLYQYRLENLPPNVDLRPRVRTTVANVIQVRSRRMHGYGDPDKVYSTLRLCEHE